MHKLMFSMGRQTLIHLLLACLLLAATQCHYSTITVEAIESGKLYYSFTSDSNLQSRTQGLAPDMYYLLRSTERRFIKNRQDPTQLGITVHHPGNE
ncbi:hypothetical protein TorRG33x02_311350 [Trema orientale]|uniref:Secreted protein n=1 Tax=Trema orientale TaxID=63057 RepID=A0A2P5BRU6_TREOI|nr:hypothetical protein TorRG33x02_311350 [Trema orientale]